MSIMSDDILDLMAVVSNGFQARLRASVSQGDGALPFGHGKALAYIARYPGCSQQRLADLLDRDKAQITRLVRDLEARALVRREAHESDWRARGLHLTESGTAALRDGMAQRSALGMAMLSSLSNAERDALWNALVKMRDALISAPGSR